VRRRQRKPLFPGGRDEKGPARDDRSLFILNHPGSLEPSPMIQLNPLLVTFLVMFAGRSAIQVVLHQVNTSFLRREGERVPDVFKDIVDRGKLKTISAYTLDSARVGMVSTLFNQAVLLVILLSGILPWLTETIRPWDLGGSPVAWPFFAILSFATHLLGLPFNLYDTFVIEERYGFNTMTFRMWVSDLAKELALSAVLGGLVLWGLLTLVVRGGPSGGSGHGSFWASSNCCCSGCFPL